MSDLVKSIKDEIKEEDLSYIKKVIKAFLSNKGVLEKQLTTLKSELDT